MRTISLCITTYERYEYLIESFAQVIHDPRISEVVIVDDCSDPLLFAKIKLFCDPYSKIKLSRNSVNIDCYRNKRKAISLSSNDWCIILDSDNTITKEYLDKIFEIEFWEPDTIYQPTFARPVFDFTEFNELLLSKANVHEHMGKKFFETSLNAMNYFVHGDEYLRVWDGNVNPHTSDSIYQNYNWLKGGNRIKYVPGLEYDHRIHEGSHYQKNNHLGGNFYEIIVNRLKSMA